MKRLMLHRILLPTLYDSLLKPPEIMKGFATHLKAQTTVLLHFATKIYQKKRNYDKYQTQIIVLSLHRSKGTVRRELS